MIDKDELMKSTRMFAGQKSTTDAFREQNLYSKPSIVKDREPETGPQFQPFDLKSNLFAERQTLHLESKLTPVGDKSMRVNWYFNGKLLEEVEEKIKIIYDYDYLSLTIYDLSVKDSGTYVCRAENKKSTSSIQFDIRVCEESSFRRQQNETLSQISAHRRSDLNTFDSDTRIDYNNLMNAATKLPPRATQSTQQIYSPQPTSYLRETTQLKSQTLNYIEDRMYEEQVKRKLDQSTDQSIFSKNLFKQQRTDKYSSQPIIHRVTNELSDQLRREDRFTRQQSADSYSQFTKQEIEDKNYLKRIEEEIIELNLRPKFLSFLYGPRKILERKQVKFEAKLIPTKRDHVQVVWLKDGQPIRNENLRELFEEGKAIMIINSITKQDSGTYTCSIRNVLGEDRVSANLEVLDQFSDERELFYEEYESTISITRFKESSDQTNDELTLLGPARAKENDVVHFEIKLKPSPAVNYEWYLNGNSLPNIDKFKTYHDDKGYAGLTIYDAKRENSGIYELKVKNYFNETLSIRKYLEIHPAFIQKSSTGTKTQAFQIPEAVYGPIKTQSIQDISINSKRARINEVDFDTEPKLPRTSSKKSIRKPGKLDDRHFVLYQVQPDKRESIRFTDSRQLSETQLTSTSKYEISQMESEKFFSQPEIYKQVDIGPQQTMSNYYQKQMVTSLISSQQQEPKSTPLLDKPLTITSSASTTDQLQKDQQTAYNEEEYLSKIYRSDLSNIEIPKNVSPDSNQKLRTSPTKKMDYKFIKEKDVDLSALDEFDQVDRPDRQMMPVFSKKMKTDKHEFSKIQLKPIHSRIEKTTEGLKPVKFTLSHPNLQIFDQSTEASTKQDKASIEKIDEKSIHGKKILTTLSEKSLAPIERTYERAGVDIKSDIQSTKYSQDSITTRSSEKKLMRYEEVQIYKDNTNVSYRVAQGSRYPLEQRSIAEISQIDSDRRMQTQTDEKIVSKLDTKVDRLGQSSLADVKISQIVGHETEWKELDSKSEQKTDSHFSFLSKQPTTITAQTKTKDVFEIQKELDLKKKIESPTLKSVSRIKSQIKKPEMPLVHLKPRKPSIEIVNVPKRQEDIDQDESDKIPRPTLESMRRFEEQMLISQRKEAFSDTQSIILEKISKPKTELGPQSKIKPGKQAEFHSTIKFEPTIQKPKSTSVELISLPKITRDYKVNEQDKSVSTIEIESYDFKRIDQKKVSEKRIRSDETVSLIKPLPQTLSVVESRFKETKPKLESTILRKEFVDKKRYDQVVSTIEQGETITKTKLPCVIHKQPKSPVHFKDEIRLEQSEVRTESTQPFAEKDIYEQSISIIKKKQIIDQSTLSDKPQFISDKTMSRIEHKGGFSKIKLPDKIQQFKTPLHTKDEIALVDKKIKTPIQYTLESIQKPTLQSKESIVFDGKIIKEEKVKIGETKHFYDEALSTIGFDDTRTGQFSKMISPSVDTGLEMPIKETGLKPLEDFETISLLKKDHTVSTKVLPSSKQMTETKIHEIQTQSTIKSKLTTDFLESTSFKTDAQRISPQTKIRKDFDKIKKPSFQPKEFDKTTISLIENDRVVSETVIHGTSPLQTVQQYLQTNIKTKEESKTPISLDLQDRIQPITDIKRSEARQYISEKVDKFKQEDKVHQYLGRTPTESKPLLATGKQINFNLNLKIFNLIIFSSIYSNRNYFNFRAT